MIDLERLTKIQGLTLNYIVWRSRQKNWSYKVDTDELLNISSKAFDVAVSEVSGYRDCLSKYADRCFDLMDNESWIMRTAHNNLCRKLSLPPVKLPGYSRSQAIAEMKETIAWVKEMYNDK